MRRIVTLDARTVALGHTPGSPASHAGRGWVRRVVAALSAVLRHR